MSMAQKNAETKVDVKPEATPTLERRRERRLRRWDPFEMFDELQDVMMRLWGQAWPLVPRPLRRMALMPTRWIPTTEEVPGRPQATKRPLLSHPARVVLLGWDPSLSGREPSCGLLMFCASLAMKPRPPLVLPIRIDASTRCRPWR